VGLPLSASVILATAADDSKSGTVDVVIRTANLEPIQHIEELHSQLGIDPFAKVEVFRQGYVFARAEGISQIADPTRRISNNPRTRAGKCCRVENR